MTRGEKAERARERLWTRLPAALRRRAPRTREERCLVLDLVEEAMRGGLSLSESARTCGVPAELFEAWRLERRRILGRVDDLEKAIGVLLATAIEEVG